MSGQRDAAGVLREHGPLTAGQVQHVMNTVAPDVDARAATGTPHGRISPLALQIDPDGAVRLIDAPESADAEGHAAPEVAVGLDTSARSEVFSLASTTYTLLTGHPPNPYGFATVRRARPDLRPQVDAVLARATARDSAFRFPTATAYASALSDALGAVDEPIVQAPDVPEARATGTTSSPAKAAAPAQPGRRFRIPDGALPVILVVLLVILAVEYSVLFLGG